MKTRSAPRPDVEAIREFNRFYTGRLGLLRQRYLESGLNLTESRVLYELAARGKATAGEIARDLDVDVAYLSRILAKFRGRRWLTRRAEAGDRRRQSLQLTAAGRAAFAPLDAAAVNQVEGMLAGLADAERRSVVAALDRVRCTLRRESASAISLRPLAIGDVGWITRRQGMLYAEEYGWDGTYEALVAKILSEFVTSFDPATDGSWIAERDGEVLGSVFLVRDQSGAGRLRLLYVEPSARGTGLGKRLVEACIEGARARGYATLTLWTNDVLNAARRIYQALGFRLVAEERHRSFGQELTGQTWDLDLHR
ncbi:MAG: GNAT family N-acetyltransferase [Proteobacteria bacterium]|nr:GNAT family N-acetyltransferase [Pseudomonadota bacterium]